MKVWLQDYHCNIGDLSCFEIAMQRPDHDAWSNNLLRIRNMILFLFGSTLLRCPVKIKIYCWSITWLMHFWDDFGFNKNLSQGEKWFLETLTIEKFEKRKQTIYSVNNSIFSADIDVDMTQLLLLGKVEYGGWPIFKVVLEC